MGGGLESRCVGRVYCLDGVVRESHGNTRNMSSSGYVNKLPCCIKLEFHIISRVVKLYKLFKLAWVYKYVPYSGVWDVGAERKYNSETANL